MLELDAISRHYGELVALDRLTLTVATGELVGLVGPNGAGKSTAMKIVFGLVRPSTGEVRWKGEPVGQAARLRFGYLPEERGLYPRMRVLDQLVYLARLHGLQRDRADDAARHWLERLGVADRAGDRADTLSLGNQQRVQLAAALVHEPELLVLDEPFAGLDPVAVDSLAAVLVEQAASGVTVVFSSHQLDLVESLCPSVAVLDRGRLVMAGSVAELRAASPHRVLEVVFGRPAPSWADGLAGVRVVSQQGTTTRLVLEPGVDPIDVLTAAAQVAPVAEFGLRPPRLSQLFLRAVGRLDGSGDALA